MKHSDLLKSLDVVALGREAYHLVERLYPICRSITGDGFRESLRIVGEMIPIESFEMPSGTAVFDWIVPQEWNIRAAWIKTARGSTVVDFANHNLHVVHYSVPIRAQLTLSELRPHLHTLPAQPELIPYRTSYYSPSWGFCLSHTRLQSLRDEDGPFEVLIDATLSDGHLTWGECVLPGAVEDEVIISCHSCHPSLANDNCSSMAVITTLVKQLQSVDRRYSYRIIFAPGTIGAIAWLAKNRANVSRIKHGLVCACLGDPGMITYKKSRLGAAAIDRIVESVLSESGMPFSIQPFSPYGYDERQYCSPGFNLPVGGFMRSPPGSFPEYHTSADNLTFVTAEALCDSLQQLLKVVRVLETNATFRNLKPFCEPRLGKRGLYNAIGGASPADSQMALLWVLNLSDGSNDLLEIAARSGLKYEMILEAAQVLSDTDLLALADS